MNLLQRFRQSSSKGFLFMLGAGLLFSVMNIFVKLSEGIPVLEVVFFRSVVSLIISYLFIRRLGISPWGHNRKLLLARGLVGCFGLVCYFYMLQRIPLATTITLSFLVPIVSSFLALLFFGEKVPWLKWVFFAVSFAGVMVVKGFDPRVNTVYFLVGIGAAVFSGLAYSIIRKLRESESANVIIFYFPLVTLPIAGVLSIGNWVWPQGWQWLYLLLIGVLTQGAQYGLTRAYQLEEVSKLAPLQYLSLFYALVFGWVFFGEFFNGYAYLGMGIVLFGVIGAVLIKPRKGKPVQTR